MQLKVNSITSHRRNLSYTANEEAKPSGEKPVHNDDELVSNDFITRARIKSNKFVKAFTVYPARGLVGHKSSNFYDFLTMGTVPYVVGSITLMSIFNSVSKHYHEFAQSKASKLGNKMALGVLFYALLKSLSENLINIPVRLKTGIDTELPYKKETHLLQEYKNDTDLTDIEYHKVGESVDFTRWDLLYGDPKKGESLNFRYDKIAKKNGLGENLNDSDQEVKPLYKEVLVKSKAAKSFATFMWAAVGVAFAFQEPWEKYFNVATLKFWKGKDFTHSLEVFKDSFVDSAKTFYHGAEDAKSFMGKHSGKMLLGSALLVTVLGVLNTLHITQKPSKVKASDVIDKNKESVVN